MVNVELQGMDVYGFPLASFTSFFALNHRASIDMKHVHRSDCPLPRGDSSPYYIRRVDGCFRKSIGSGTDSLGQCFQMMTGYRQHIVRRKGGSKLFGKERENEGWLGRM